MVRATPTQPHQSAKQLVERIISSGQLSRQQHLQLTSLMLSDYRVSDEDRRQINRIFDYVQTGRLKFVD